MFAQVENWLWWVRGLPALMGTGCELANLATANPRPYGCQEPCDPNRGFASGLAVPPSVADKSDVLALRADLCSCMVLLSSGRLVIHKAEIVM
jgi:hypothetical protein